MIVSRTVATPETTVAVVMVTLVVAIPLDGFVSPITEHTTAAFKVEAVLSVISRSPLSVENVVLATGALRPALVQVAAGDNPVKPHKASIEIKLTALLASVPVKLTVKVTATDTTLLLNAVDAV